jgi:hypothetical protein
MIAHGFSADMERAGECSFLLDATLYSLLHDLPDQLEMFPYSLFSFDVVYIFPESMSCVIAPVHYFRQRRHVVQIAVLFGFKGMFHADYVSTSDAVVCPFVIKIAIAVD